MIGDGNVKHFKRSLFLPILLLAALVLFAGCNREEPEQLRSAKQFLTEFFTYNSNGRYEKLEADIGGADIGADDIAALPQEMLQAYDSYYSLLSKLATAECIENMKQNRYPIKYEKQGRYSLLNIDIAPDNGAYSFTAELSYDGGAVEKVSGTVTLNSENIVEKITVS